MVTSFLLNAGGISTCGQLELVGTKCRCSAIKVGEILSDVEMRHGFPLIKLSLSLSRTNLVRKYTQLISGTKIWYKK